MKVLNKYLIIFSLLFTFCTPQKRLNRLIKKHPELSVLDTIIIRDTIIVENYLFDTITNVRFFDTTIIVNNEKLVAKYYFDTLRKEIWHEIECKQDTIYYQKIVEVQKVEFKELSWWETYKHIVYFILVLIISLFLLKKFKKYFPFL